MTEMQWIKLRIDMFDDEKIKIIQSMPDGDALLVVWIRLIALAGKCNANGLVLVGDEFPYTDEMLSVIFNKPLATIKLALKTFEQFRMVEKTVKGIYITNFEKHQNIEGMDKIREQNRIRKQREREKRSSLLLEKKTGIVQNFDNKNRGATGEVTNMSRDMSQRKSRVVTGEVTDMSHDVTEDVTNMSRDMSQRKSRVVTGEVTDMSHDVTEDVTNMSRDMSQRKSRVVTGEVTDMSHDVTEDVTNMSRDVTQQNKNKNKEYIDIYSDEYILSDSTDESDTQMQKKNISYRQIMDDYNMTCIDLPKIQTISEERRRKIRTLMNGMDKDKILPGKTAYERLHAIFQLTHESDFLSGRDGKWSRCSFDWMITKKNALKILEGTYANKGGTDKSGNSVQGNAENATSKNRFNQFQRQDYKIDELEKELLSN